MNLAETDIAEIVAGVWDSMLGLPVDLLPPGPAPELASSDLVTGSVTVTGASDCVVALQLGSSGARAFAAAMFGIDTGEVGDDEIADAVGELTNMVGGNIKSLLPEPSLLSLPTVSCGSAVRVRIPGGGGTLTAVSLLSGDELIVVHVWSRGDGGASSAPLASAGAIS